MNQSIESNLKKIASLHNDSLKIIHQIEKLSYSDNIEDIELPVPIQRANLSTEALKKIKQMKDVLIEINLILKNFIDADDKRDCKLELIMLYDKWEEKLNDLRLDLRAAQLKSYQDENHLNHNQRLRSFKNVYSKDKEEKELATERAGNKEEASKNFNEKILSKNETITSSLQTSRRLIESSVIQSELNFDELNQQNKDIASLNDKYSSFNSVLNGTKKLVRLIEEQDKGDRRRLRWSIGFFLLCCSWVLYRRIFKVPVKILLWSVFKIFKIFFWVFGSSKNKETGIIQEIYKEILITGSVGDDIATATTEFLDSFDDGLSVTFSETISHSWETFTEATGRIMDEL